MRRASAQTRSSASPDAFIRYCNFASARYDCLSYFSNVLMRAAKIAITIEKRLLSDLDRLVKQRRFPNRSQAIQEALRDKLESIECGRLARECAKLDPAFEQRLADE